MADEIPSGSRRGSRSDRSAGSAPRSAAPRGPSAPHAIFRPRTWRNSVPAPAPSRATVRTVTGPSPMSISVSTIVGERNRERELAVSGRRREIAPRSSSTATSSTALPAVDRRVSAASQERQAAGCCRSSRLREAIEQRAHPAEDTPVRRTPAAPRRARVPPAALVHRRPTGAAQMHAASAARILRRTETAVLAVDARNRAGRRRPTPTSGDAAGQRLDRRQPSASKCDGCTTRSDGLDHRRDVGERGRRSARSPRPCALDEGASGAPASQAWPVMSGPAIDQAAHPPGCSSRHASSSSSTPFLAAQAADEEADDAIDRQAELLAQAIALARLGRAEVASCRWRSGRYQTRSRSARRRRSVSRSMSREMHAKASAPR